MITGTALRTGRAATHVSLDITSATPSDAGTLTAHATTTFDRAGLGVRAPRFLIGRRIAVPIDATFAPPSAHPPGGGIRAAGKSGSDHSTGT
jgi:hypothetical protein